MEGTTMRHGGLALVIAFEMCGWRAYAGSVDPQRVQSRDFEIVYAVDEAAQPLESARLWYTLDQGATWRDAGLDPDRRSPFAFRAPQEGLYGFFFVLQNAAGTSSEPPTHGTEPHQWVFVDATRPVVQLHSVRSTTSLGQPLLQIRWTAVDANFGARPIHIEFQRQAESTWHAVVTEPQANTGCYDWRMPFETGGSLRVRVAATDRGGNRTVSDSKVAELGAVAEAANESAIGQSAGPAGGWDGASANSLVPKENRDRAAQLFGEAEADRERGAYRQAIGKLRNVVRLAPQWTEAFVEMADLLYLVGDWDRALSAYDIVLKQAPAHRAALRGAARVYRQRNDNAAAAVMLRTILRQNPNDAEVWMNLGDVAIYQGDEVLARECYTRAAEIDPAATDVIADARRRLALMSDVSHHYRSTGSRRSGDE